VGPARFFQSGETRTKDLGFDMPYWIYMMTNASRHPIYTGFTGDLVERVRFHKNKIEEGYTKKYNLVRLVFFEEHSYPDVGIEREKEIKGWRREKKNALVETKNPRWADLSPMPFQHFKPSSRASAATGRRQ